MLPNNASQSQSSCVVCGESEVQHSLLREVPEAHHEHLHLCTQLFWPQLEMPTRSLCSVPTILGSRCLSLDSLFAAPPTVAATNNKVFSLLFWRPSIYTTT